MKYLKMLLTNAEGSDRTQPPFWLNWRKGMKKLTCMPWKLTNNGKDQLTQSSNAEINFHKFYLKKGQLGSDGPPPSQYSRVDYYLRHHQGWVGGASRTRCQSLCFWFKVRPERHREHSNKVGPLSLAECPETLVPANFLFQCNVLAH